MDAEVKFKPCPFCGGNVVEAEHIDGESFPLPYAVKCRGCYAEGPTSAKKVAAIALWNSRN